MISRADRLKPLWDRCSGGGIEHPEGWDHIVLALDREITKVNPDYAIFQTKEKFGGLRFYLGGDFNLAVDVENLITEAEEACSKTCMICAAPGELRSHRGWMTVQCDQCWRSHGKEE